MVQVSSALSLTQPWPEDMIQCLRSREDRAGRPVTAWIGETIRLLERRALRIPAQDLELVPQHKDLQLLRPRRPETEHRQLEQTANDQVRKRPHHARPPTDGEAA